ncbi:MAG: hypothetical protein ACRCXT_05810 [Paraclostridium sp.]
MQVLFDRDTNGNQHLEFKIGEYSIKCGYISKYTQGADIYFSNSFSKIVYYASGIQHLSTSPSTSATNIISTKDVMLNKMSLQFMSPNGLPAETTTIMWIAVGK